MLKELVQMNRSTRRFQQDVPISMETLRDLVDLARLSATGSNRQPLKFMLSCDSEKNALIFPQLSWAGYYRDWPGPEEGERPSGYIIVLGDSEINANRAFGVDHGIAMQSILLGATEQGLSGCIIGSVKRDALREALKIDARYEILNVVAIGKQKETIVIDPLGPDGDIKYWRDAQGVHHVPKRALADIIVG